MSCLPPEAVYQDGPRSRQARAPLVMLPRARSCACPVFYHFGSVDSLELAEPLLVLPVTIKGTCMCCGMRNGFCEGATSWCSTTVRTGSESPILLWSGQLSINVTSDRRSIYR